MNVLSLFDGMSCGQIALEKAGIKVDNYFASEIDKYAIKITQKNYPNTIQLGDVKEFDLDKLPKIDLLIGGSPCQGFSFAGKQLNFNDERSALFFVYVHILETIKPKYFLLENVKMKKEYEDVITSYMGVKPVKINSSLVSAQNRERLYWTNIPNITQPEDKRLVINDILEPNIESEYQEPYVKLNGNTTGYVGYVGNAPKQATKIYSSDGKSVSLIANGGGQGGKTGLYQIKNQSTNKDGKAYSLTATYAGAVAWNSIQKKQRTMVAVCESDEDNPNVVDGVKYRKLTPIECERLQNVPDNYTEGVSNAQRYKMLGNGWTVGVIAHILGNINEKI